MVPRLSDSLELDDWPRWWSGLGSGHHPRRGAVTTLVHQVGFELHPFRVKEPVIRLEPMRYTGCIGHGKRASPAPSPRWGGVEKANCGSSEPWNRRGGGSFDPRHPRVWECASRRGSQTGSPHGVGKPPVLFAPHGASEKTVRLTASGPDPFPSPGSTPPVLSRLTARRCPLFLSRGTPQPVLPATHGAHEPSVVYCEFRVGIGRWQVGSLSACRGTGLLQEWRGLALSMPGG